MLFPLSSFSHPLHFFPPPSPSLNALYHLTSFIESLAWQLDCVLLHQYSLLLSYSPIIFWSYSSKGGARSTDKNREFGDMLGSGEKGQEISKHQGRSGYVKDNPFESKAFCLLYFQSLTPHKISEWIWGLMFSCFAFLRPSGQKLKKQTHGRQWAPHSHVSTDLLSGVPFVFWRHYCIITMY